jgi:hypothetical protein
VFNFLRLLVLTVAFSTGVNSTFSSQAAASQIYPSVNVTADFESADDSEAHSGMKTLAAFTILGAGAAVLVASAKRGGYLPQSIHWQLQPDQADVQLQKKLLRLLHNDRDAAARLLTQIQRTHPERSANWVIEKVIYDLERDRNRH